MVDFKQIVSTFTYRIEQKPDGGFVAYPSDPNLPHIEAPTRMELNQKIQERIRAALSSQFPGLSLPPEDEHRKVSFHLEARPEGGFKVHYSNPNARDPAHAEGDFLFGEKMVNLMARYLTPEVIEKLRQKAAAGDVNVAVNRKAFTTMFDSKNVATGGAKNFPTFSSSGPTTGTISANDNLPIAPETSNTWKIFRFLFFLLLACALLYFFAHR